MAKISRRARAKASAGVEAAASSPSTYKLQRGPPVPNPRRKPTLKTPRRDVLLGNGRTLVQPHVLPKKKLPRINFSASSETERNATDNFDPSASSSHPDAYHISFLHDQTDHGTYQRKKITQSTRWQEEVLPLLVPVLATLLQETKSLRDLHSTGRSPRHSSCNCPGRNLKVTIVRWASMEDVHLFVCPCAPAPVQLMRLGAFGSSPVHPSLAVDLHVLEFFRNLFLQVSPNTAAVSKTLEHVLSEMGFQLDHENSLRRRFGNCLSWYTYLRNLLKHHYAQKIELARDEVVGPRQPPSMEEPRGRSPTRSGNREASSSVTPTPRAPRRSSSSSSSSRSTSPPARTRKRRRSPSRSPSPAPQSKDTPFPEPQARERPSEYLRRRCPLCFGNLKHDPTQKFDVPACTDACFGQKHNLTNAIDALKAFPDTRFISEDVLARMEEYVDSQRKPSRRRTKKPRHNKEDEEEDDYDSAGQKLPRSVLDACEASFKAADEKRVKASTKFFDNTGLMALVCRHDNVLFLANMKSAGEKQFYVLALIETLFQHLPTDIRVGLLYDVVCILERSCLKWGFLERYMDRLEFAVSVFHAFGHEWACQLVYHPRKRVGFGFTDGEGCERFWKSIKHLIAHLRISGYYNRLYTLDAQITHNDEQNLFRAGEWLLRRYRRCMKKRREAAEKLRLSGKSPTELREQFALQVKAQTKPLARQKKTNGEKFVNSIIIQRSVVETRTARVEDLTAEFLAAASAENPSAAVLDTELREAREGLRKAKETLRKKEQALGLANREDLRALAKSEYMRELMNAQALLLRTRARLRTRKFELDAVERSFRRLLSQTKLHAHTESAVKRREPTISKLAARYNKACQKVAKLIKDGKAPPHALAPSEIPPGGLWKLDVDDVVFQDIAFDDDEAEAPPLWLSDDNVRDGIKALLELDRCDEEDARLLREKIAMREWFAEEWEVIQRAVDSAESDVDKYHFKLHQTKLLRLCSVWDKAAPDLGEDKSLLRAWGPSAIELAQCRLRAHCAARGEDDDDSDDGGEPVEVDGEEEEYEVLETLERADSYRNEAVDHDDVLEDMDFFAD
ncbi:hypothetical protein R3P38DRAFT_3207371 [Favolaschia claudopus]|uniref:CxC1-like cysteine cluster associated with KDZ transposases domain-containing protein n=1 Tax=Favolaschia claudopus TaxID=2862362 RepID=A0AAV9Z732_9AGAR